uniref:ORF37 n=1 Tax=Nitrosopumilaceae spindle-shaped virus TaxID=3065433 RepID=A0AAT9J7C4_9VIRU
MTLSVVEIITKRIVDKTSLLQDNNVAILELKSLLRQMGYECIVKVELKEIDNNDLDFF